MGIIKEYYFDMLEEKYNSRLASILGITTDELDILEPVIEEYAGYDETLYSYVVSFKKDSPQDILKKINRIDNNHQVWIDSWELDIQDYEDYTYTSIPYKNSHEEYQQSIINIDRLNKIKLETEELDKIVRKQIYCSIVSSLELFLYETIINLTKSNSKYVDNIIINHPRYKEPAIANKTNSEKQKMVKSALMNLNYHNLEKVSVYYNSAFNINFPAFEDLKKHLTGIRNDVVHRNGKTLDGDIVEITENEINELLNLSNKLVDYIAERLNLNSLPF